jgi:hypothetical protein
MRRRYSLKSRGHKAPLGLIARVLMRTESEQQLSTIAEEALLVVSPEMVQSLALIERIVG